MKITIVCDVLGDENNGTTIAAMNLIRSLKAKGHRVSVVCPDKTRLGQDGYYILPTINLGPLNGYVARNGVSLAYPDKNIITAALDGADVVHVMIPFAAGRVAANIAKERGIALTAGFHCQAENFTNHIFLMNSRLVNHLTYKIFYRVLYSKCDCVHYPTEFICDLFESETSPTNHYVISNGVAADFVSHPAPHNKSFENKIVILSTGRYSKEKSQRTLIDAVALSKYAGKIQLILAGKGPREKHLRNQALNAGILPPVFGFHSHNELIDIINSADLYVHPAEIEIEAIACLEAISCGLVPIVSDSRRSATRNFALTENNIFRCNDACDLAEKIDYWIDHPAEKAHCAEKYAGFSESHRRDVCMDKMEQMLLDAVKINMEQLRKEAEKSNA